MRKRVGVIVGMATALAAAAALAESPDGLSHKTLRTIGEGRAVYLTYCARCHGAEAHGGLTTIETEPAPDLALITVRDGSFNPIHVSNHVSGRFVGCKREMPCWSKVFARSQNPDGKVLAVTRYLDFIQEPALGPAER